MTKKTDPKKQEGDEKLFKTLRPRKLEEFNGQDQIKKNLDVLIKASQKREEAIDHLLFYGPPGLGKTTLANVIASEMGVSIRITSGPAIERSGDLAAILTNLQAGDILFIDEIHRLNKVVEETLYPAMEDFALDIVVGKGPAARTLRLELPHFTIIGATTRVGALSSPLRDCFGAMFRLQFYNKENLREIILRSGLIMDLDINEEAASTLAIRCRRTPRIANRLLRRVRDYVQINGDGKIDKKMLVEALEFFEIDSLGLEISDRMYLNTLCKKYGGGPVGIETMAATLADDVTSIEEVCEPYLMQLGFVKRTKQGRVATKRAFEYLKK
jgi:holliday junction DNA helicase RuvB